METIHLHPEESVLKTRDKGKNFRNSLELVGREHDNIKETVVKLSRNGKKLEKGMKALRFRGKIEKRERRNFQQRTLFPVKIFFKTEGKIKVLFVWVFLGKMKQTFWHQHASITII